MITDYSRLTRAEILRFALQRGEQADEDRVAFDAELSRRKIPAHEISDFSSAEQTAAVADEKVVREVLFWGIGKKLSGRRNYVHDPQFSIEEFDRTLWFVFFLISICPLGIYRIRRRFRRRWQLCAPTATLDCPPPPR